MQRPPSASAGMMLLAEAPPGPMWLPIDQSTIDQVWEFTLKAQFVSAAADFPFEMPPGHVAVRFDVPPDEVVGVGSACFWVTDDPDGLLRDWTLAKEGSSA